ncbi:MAG: 16S rRNA (adenine(1518)-N(6)/adenine(1519)-N(6))-dimethyltransferase RsmA [Gammaproteobacteria bacterium]|jgi:16S rRNA (adenine1518-N6/adenine1519-N6)-dimethyltransferase|nr:16S rRNA (adenine(1518)-N(6)/adenine(1519)-N(6))-dimethyltransferase RsmA [Gammaproteobacteria bacterium]MDH3751425.1 16S rRNA (adenine(1518)-N(6)/adenine(1519)-N(6))-dimethyltransferase RsmA [Gammaproteobacteria bacterium]MDH3804572.1 16S rRNA (adenine(1518)-N(6)/adenine(1519)-N(6))-dimethyltransferase RsmA [Gammaproteobacteria bacterium]
MSQHRPRKRFGQHFLTDPGVIEAIVRAIAASRDDVVVEIGPGQGAITRSLASRAGLLHAIELDRDLAARLVREFGAEDNVTIHAADALTFDYGALGNSLRIVGNLPYNISTPLLFKLLKMREHITDMHFMLQKEVVDRMAASPGSKAYGRLGIMLGCRFQIDALFDVDRLAFDPPPDVTSAVVRLAPLPAGTYVIDDEERLSKLVAQAFSQRRKTIRNSLRSVADEAMLESVGIDPGLRPEAISIADYVRLANTLE